MQYLLTETIERDTVNTIVEADDIDDMSKVIKNFMREAMDDAEFDPATSKGEDDDWGYNENSDLNTISAWYSGNSNYDWEVSLLSDVKVINHKDLIRL